MSKKVIIDCDPGTDDAIALMLALSSEELEIMGVTTVNGNRSVDMTTENALRIISFVNAETPVYKGCSIPMVSTLTIGRRPGIPIIHADDMHGDFLDIPETSLKPETVHAVIWLIDKLMKSDSDITIAAVGPLTNIAMALRLEPRIEDKIKEIIIMGGGHAATNMNASAEFNFWVDPEAAQIVMCSKIKKTIIPLDATIRGCITEKQMEELSGLGTPMSETTVKMAKLRQNEYCYTDISENNRHLREKTGGTAGTLLFHNEKDRITVHDALAVAYLIKPDIITEMVDAVVNIDISSGICDGRMVIDFYPPQGFDSANLCRIAVSADEDAFGRLLINRLSK